MRVLILASLASSLVRFRGDLIQALLDAGHEVLAGAPDPDDVTVQQLRAWGVQCVATPLARSSMNPLSDVFYLRTLRKLIRQLGPDVVLAYTPKPVIYSGLACRGRAVRHYALISGLGYGFGSETLLQRLLTPVMSALFRMGMKHSARVIFQNPDDRDLFVATRIVEAQRTCIVAGSGVDPDRFAVQPLPPNPVFLLMARLIPEKGIREYIEAARRIRTEVPDAVFLLAGWLEERSGAISKQELSSWQSEGIVEYLGVLDDVRPALARASIYVLPSYYREGVPRSILEAMAMGRAIVTTDAPGCRETVRQGENGFLVRPREAGDLAARMLQLAREPQLVARMGARSRHFAEQRFAVGAINREMLREMELLK